MPTLKQIQKSDNVAELLSSEQLSKIALEVVRGYEIDEQSRAEWKKNTNKAVKLAKMQVEERNHPWPKASNVVYPLISEASIEVSSRIVSDIIQNNKVVRAGTIGIDDDDELYKRAQNVSNYMSWQCIEESPDWQDVMDSLIQGYPVMGTVFTKTYWCELEKRNVVEYCIPDKICVNHNIKDLPSARRITHKIVLYKNDIIERIRKGLYLNVNIDRLRPMGYDAQDCDYPIELLEQHCWYDLDYDGYKEPYIVIVHQESRQILRIKDRIDEIEYNNKNQIAKIIPEDYFTGYHCIKNPDGGYYSMGFGSLLLSSNHSINSIINNLIDSGTLNNLKSGFYSRGLKIKAGEIRMKPGELISVDVPSGQNIKDSIYYPEYKEPSTVLYQLLQLLITASKELTASTDTLSGNQPSQNVSNNVYSQTLEQGATVLTNIKKRFHRALSQDFQKLYKLNSKYLDNKKYRTILNDKTANVKDDFELGSLTVYPVADPSISSEQQRLQKISVIQQLKTIDARAADQLTLETIQIDRSWQKKLLPDNMPPSPDVLKIQSEIALQKAQISQLQMQQQIESYNLQLEMTKAQQDAKESNARINNLDMQGYGIISNSQHNNDKLQVVATKMRHQELMKEVELLHNLKNTQHQNMLDNIDAVSKIRNDAVNQEVNKTRSRLDDVSTAHNISKESVELALKNKEIEANKQRDIANDNSTV